MSVWMAALRMWPAMVCLLPILEVLSRTGEARDPGKDALDAVKNPEASGGTGLLVDVLAHAAQRRFVDALPCSSASQEAVGETSGSSFSQRVVEEEFPFRCHNKFPTDLFDDGREFSFQFYTIRGKVFPSFQGLTFSNQTSPLNVSYQCTNATSTVDNYWVTIDGTKDAFEATYSFGTKIVMKYVKAKYYIGRGSWRFFVDGTRDVMFCQEDKINFNADWYTCKLTSDKRAIARIKLGAKTYECLDSECRKTRPFIDSATISFGRLSKDKVIGDGPSELWPVIAAFAGLQRQTQLPKLLKRWRLWNRFFR